MAKQSCRAGGFTAQNNGTIINCYSAVRLKPGKCESGGFTALNTGSIENSFSCGPLGNLVGGFSGKGKEHTKNAWFFVKGDIKNHKVKKRTDAEYCKSLDENQKLEVFAQMGYDMENVWALSRNKAVPMGFIPDCWSYDVAHSPRYGKLADRKPIEIGTAAELFELAKRINEGDTTLSGLYIRLSADIDLKGKEWTPIGGESGNDFTGLFDGCGHTVKNFVIKDKRITHKGFFGLLRGEVYNLSVECKIKGTNGYIGGIAARCESTGIIGCCSAAVELRGKTGAIGGLCGYNAGLIFHSCSVGIIRRSAAFMIWFLLMWTGALAAGGAVVAVNVLLPMQNSQTFAPVPYDEYIVPIEDENVEELSDPTDSNFVSFQFEQKIDVSLSSSECAFNFKNPSNSNKNIVVQLQFTDEEAIAVMGSTGRTQEEQEKLDKNSAYDPAMYRMVLAESGAIPPGYQLSDLRLVQQPNGAKLPAGQYNAIVYLIFYDTQTNERAMLDSQLPVVINVQG